MPEVLIKEMSGTLTGATIMTAKMTVASMSVDHRLLELADTMIETILTHRETAGVEAGVEDERHHIRGLPVEADPAWKS